MSQEDILVEIKRKFEGKWKVDKSENFDDFMREVGKCLRSFFTDLCLYLMKI